MRRKKQYKFNNFFTRTIRFLTIVFAAALVVSDFAGRIDPRSFWPPAFAGLAYVPLFAVNILFLLINIAGRKKILAAIPFLAILLGWNTVSNTFSLKSASPLHPKASPAALRIFTWNIHYFQDVSGQPLRDSQRDMISLITDASPDIVCMQEFYIPYRDTSAGTDSLKKQLNMPFAYFRSMEAPDKGMVIFSKFPIVNQGLVAFSNEPSGNQCIFADILKDGKKMRIYAVHLESIRLRDEQLNYISKLVKGKEDNMKPSRKIAGQLRNAFLARSGQVELVKESAAACPYPYVICGDFNDPPSSYAFQQMASGLKNTFAEKGSGFFPVTYYRGFLKYQIDHILVSSGVRVFYHHIIAKKVSDHYPVLADIGL